MAFDWGVGFFFVDLHAAAADPVVDDICVWVGCIDAECVIVPADAERVGFFHLASGFVEDDAEFGAGGVAVVAEAGDDGIEGEEEAESADGGHGGEHADAASGGFFEEADESDDDGAACEHDESCTGESALDEDGAGDEACGAPVAAAEDRAEGGGEEGHGDHDGVHGERVLVFEGAADLVDAVEVFHFEADEGLPAHGEAHGGEEELHVFGGAEPVEGGDGDEGEEGHFMDGHEGVVGAGCVGDGEGAGDDEDGVEGHAWGEPAEGGAIAEPCGGDEGDGADVIEVEVVALGVAAVFFDGGEGEAPIACGEETVDGHEAHEAEETALGDGVVFDGCAESGPESEEEGQDDGQLDPVGGGHGARRSFRGLIAYRTS